MTDQRDTSGGVSTPKTDEARDRCRDCGLEFVPLEDMRQLERELADMKDDYLRVHKDKMDLMDKYVFGARSAIEPVAYRTWHMGDGVDKPCWYYEEEPQKWGHIWEPLYVAPSGAGAGETRAVLLEVFCELKKRLSAADMQTVELVLDSIKNRTSREGEKGE